MNIDTEELIKIIPYSLYNKFYYLLVFKNQESLGFNKHKNFDFNFIGIHSDKFKDIFQKLRKEPDLLVLNFEELKEKYCNIPNEEYSKKYFIEILENSFKNEDMDLIISLIKENDRESINYAEDLIYEYLENNILSFNLISILTELISCCVIGF